MALSTYEAQRTINSWRGTTPTAPAAVYLSMHTASPGVTGASEVTGGSYARQAVALDAPTGKTTTNTAAEEFSALPACTITHAGLWDALTEGNFIVGGTVTPNKVVAAGENLRFPAGDADFVIDP